MDLAGSPRVVSRYEADRGNLVAAGNGAGTFDLRPAGSPVDGHLPVHHHPATNPLPTRRQDRSPASCGGLLASSLSTMEELTWLPNA
ncbi:hypothetical protein [Winogradskya consettensis]|uniref:hypothetical protein n=1 Tax=Winogradskya consettensis TaxID=113560 RepID=UPI001BB45D57|nr:hypothetical protein [Actinoplanes consettensis]